MKFWWTREIHQLVIEVWRALAEIGFLRDKSRQEVAKTCAIAVSSRA